MLFQCFAYRLKEKEDKPDILRKGCFKDAESRQMNCNFDQNHLTVGACCDLSFCNRDLNPVFVPKQEIGSGETLRPIITGFYRTLIIYLLIINENYINLNAVPSFN